MKEYIYMTTTLKKKKKIEICESIIIAIPPENLYCIA